MTDDDRFSVRPYQPGDEQGILDLFNAVFAEDNPAYVPRTMERWRWEWLENPAGTDHMVLGVENATGRVVCQYACIPYRVSLRGEETLAGCGVDSFLHPDYRQGLKREGIWLRVARHYFAEVGRMPTTSWGYGTPNDKAWRVGVRVLGYQEVQKPQPHLVRTLRAGMDHSDVGGGLASAVRWEEIHAFDDRFDRLWDAVAPTLSMATIRDARYLQWRYGDAADVPYRSFATLDADGALRGFMVVRPDWQAPGILGVNEVFCHPDDDGTFAALLVGINEFALKTGQGRIEFWLAPSCRLFDRATAMGFTAEPGHFNLAIVPYRDDLEIGWVRDHWYYTLGDIDAF